MLAHSSIFLPFSSARGSQGTPIPSLPDDINNLYARYVISTGTASKSNVHVDPASDYDINFSVLHNVIHVSLSNLVLSFIRRPTTD